MFNKSPAYYQRFSLGQRIEHAVMMTCFGTLATTGLVQKFALNDILQFIVKLVGGVENLRMIHHAAAIVFMLGVIYHLVFVGYKFFVERVQMSMLPGIQDAKDAFQAFFYNLGFVKQRPEMGRYTFEEKAEYWAFAFGTVVVITTGFFMWNPIITTQFLPGQFIPAAKAAHGNEAVLAVLAILVWHIYGVYIKFVNRSMWTGNLSEHEMLEEHPLELADIKAGKLKRTIDPAQLKKRQMIYLPIAVVLTAVLLFGVYSFVTVEKTVITTIPPIDVGGQIYKPQTATPLPTHLPTRTPRPSPTS
jgi:cytochrome b subunit of formate dehydrogenase